MQVVVEIPDEMARKLAAEGQDPSRAALEAMAIEGYRSGALTAAEVRRLLGFETRYELDGFLKAQRLKGRIRIGRPGAGSPDDAAARR